MVKTGRLFWLFVGATASTAACEEGVFGPFGGLAVEPVDTVFVARADAAAAAPMEPPPAAIRVDSLWYSASVMPLDTALSDPPMSLRLQVTVRNPLDTAVVLPVAGCTVWPHVFATPDRADDLWDTSGVQCAQESYTVTIQAHDSVQLSHELPEVSLGLQLPDGRYYLTAEFRRAAGTLMLPAGSADVRLEEPGLTYAVSLDPAGRGVTARVTVTNTNSSPVYLEYGNCALELALYRDAQRTQLVAPWRWTDYCLDYLATKSLGAGESFTPPEFRATFSAWDLPRDDLRPGRYFLQVLLRLNWRTLAFAVGEIEIR